MELQVFLRQDLNHQWHFLTPLEAIELLQSAQKIARQLTIDRDLDGQPLQTIHGRDLEGLDEEGWRQVVKTTAVFARVSPEQKLKIVEALQAQGNIVAMTGDGVNDAPALKVADIGIAMGVKGTEIAKENADMVITDDNFASIVHAVEQGRCIYENIKRCLHYLLSCNFSELLTIFLALILNFPLPLVALQILWLNLVTDVLPAFALAIEPSSPDSMRRPPRDPNDSILTTRFAGLIIWQGLLLACVTLLSFWIGLQQYGNQGDEIRKASTMAFMTLAFAQIFHTFSTRSQRRLTFATYLFTNSWFWAAMIFCLSIQIATPYLTLSQRLLHIVPPSASDWIVILACSLLPVFLVELTKIVRLELHRLAASNNLFSKSW